MDIVTNGRILGNVGMHSLPGELNKFVIFLSEVFVQGPTESFGTIRWHLVAQRSAFTDDKGVAIPAGWIVFDREYAYDQINLGNLLLYPNAINLIHQHVSHQYDILGQYRNIFPVFTPNDSAIKSNPLSTYMLKEAPTPEPFTMLGDGVSKEYILNLITSVTPIAEIPVDTSEVRTTGLGVPDMLAYSADTDLNQLTAAKIGLALVAVELGSRVLRGKSLFFPGRK